MKVVTFKVEENLLAMLDRYALNHGLNRSEAIRRAIENLVKDEVNKEKAVVRVVDFW
ncbi:MAG: ribbon-helix-helix protein, CopG family [Acidianus infernus]|nr:ribbon-helix-helix protein, CopG family [Acidianus infernus]